jgi:hypothetical protein
MRNPIRNTSIWLLLLLLMAIPSGAAVTVKVSGTVVDEYGKPVELAIVRAASQSTIGISNAKGKYSFTCPRQDSLVIICSMLGYRTKRQTVQNPSDSILVDFKISSLGRTLSSAQVSTYRRQTEALMHVKPGSTKFMPSTTGNGVEELIATQMGVSTHNEMSSQYNVRGGSFDENSVYLNGVEVYRPLLVSSGQQEGLSIINSHMVDDITFSAGGFPAKYGDKMSSVLDITYKRPQQFEASLAASMLGADAYMGFGNKKFSMMNGLRYKTMRYLLSSLETNGEYRPAFFDYQNYTSWRPNDHWSIDFIGYASSNHYKFVPKDRETKFGTMNDAKSFKVYFDGQEKDAFNTLFGSLGITHNFSKKTRLTLQSSVYSTKERETYDISGEYWLNEATTQQQLGVGTYMEHARNFLTARVANLQLLLKHEFGSHRLEGGMGWETQKVKENSTEWEMRDSSDYSIPHSTDRLDLIYSLRAKTDINTQKLHFYVQDTYRWQSTAGIFTFNYGLRASHWSWNKEWLVSPRASIGFIPAGNENFTFRFATGVYYQQPFYKEIRDTVTTASGTVVRLNKDIKSQRSIHFLLGGDYQFRMGNRPYRFTTELYYKALHNLIPYNVNNLRIVYYGENLTSGYATGVDFKLFGEFVPGTDSWITLSLMSTREKSGGKSFPRPTDQRYNLSLFFTDYFPGSDRWKLTLKGALADGLPFGMPHKGIEHNVFRAPAYKRVDIGMSYRLLNNEDRHIRKGFSGACKNVWLGVDAFNILGINNVNSYYWVTDITNTQYAVPNYLTGRIFNFKVLFEF